MTIKKDIGFWNLEGIYIPDVQEIGAEEMDKNFNEFFDELNDMANFKNFGESKEEEIIIDGVNVEDCSYYNKDNYPYCCEVWDNECEAQNCYYKQLKRLQQENARLKNERTADLVKQIDELKAENERLKEEVETRDNLVEHFRKEAINWAKISNDCIKDIENYKQTLQEIKAIAAETIDIYYPDYYDEGFEEDIVTEFAKQVLDLITKAEEE